jgi:DNA invertase Pin-like site-specific DNA recombinase
MQLSSLGVKWSQVSALVCVDCGDSWLAPRRVSQPLCAALTAAGVDADRVYTDKLSGASARAERPGLAALLDYAREGDGIVVIGIDRLGRNAAEVMTTIRELGERGIVLRSLREGIDTSNATGRMVAGVLASLAELELELGRERRTAARDARRARGQSIGRP